MRRVIRIGLAVLVGFPLMSLMFLFHAGSGARMQPPARKQWEAPPQT